MFAAFAPGLENKLLRRDALLMTRGDVKRVFVCAIRLSALGPALSV
jgi:hypothetical protein